MNKIDQTLKTIEESVTESNPINAPISSEHLESVRVVSTLASVVLIFVFFILVLIIGAVVWALR